MLSDEDGLFMRLEQERANEAAEEWEFAYGFAHQCKCADDAENGNTTEIPECYATACTLAFEALRKARGTLYAIATSTDDDAPAMKQLANEAFFVL